MRVNSILTINNYNFKTNKVKKNTQTINPLITISPQKTQSPTFCGLLINLDRLKEQHKIVNKAYSVQGQAIRAINHGKFLKDNAEYFLKQTEKNTYSFPQKNIALSKYNFKREEDGSTVADCTFNKNNKELSRNIIRYDNERNIKEIAVNVKVGNDFEILEADEIFYFNNGLLTSYVQGFVNNEFNDSVDIKGQYSFINNNLTSYSKNIVIDTQTDEINTEETFEYKNGRISDYKKNIHFSPETLVMEIEKHCTFDTNEKIVTNKNNVKNILNI